MQQTLVIFGYKISTGKDHLLTIFNHCLPLWGQRDKSHCNPVFSLVLCIACHAL